MKPLVTTKMYNECTKRVAKRVRTSYLKAKGYKATDTERYGKVLNDLAENIDREYPNSLLIEVIGYLQRENQNLLNTHTEFRQEISKIICRDLNYNDSFKKGHR